MNATSPRSAPRGARGRLGITLMELSVALMIFTGGILGSVTLYDRAVVLTRRVNDRLRAETWIASKLDECRGWSRAELAAPAAPDTAGVAELPGVEPARRVRPIEGRPGVWEVTVTVRWRPSEGREEELTLTTWTGGRE
ncbi:MAG: hypothetical protein HYZ53_09340 [Planctomycetes bacterium]|nr:hypothetical protein [Planctomycetota bacterium]